MYCILWNEFQSDRSGNDIASACTKLLETVVSENVLITWSDSCVQQNRNSLISNAVLHFLKENPQINSVTMKYSLPGHSCCPDSAYSVIEKAMKKVKSFHLWD